MPSILDVLTKGPTVILGEQIMKEKGKKNAAQLTAKQARARVAELEAQLATPTGGIQWPNLNLGPSQVLQYVRGSDGQMYPVITSASPPLAQTTAGTVLPVTPYGSATLSPPTPEVTISEPAGAFGLPGIDPKMLAIGGAALAGVYLLTAKKKRR